VYPRSLVCPSSFTFVARFNHDLAGGIGEYLFDQQSPRSVVTIAAYNVSPKVLGVYNGSGNWGLGPLLPSGWHTFGWVVDIPYSTVRFYIDGVLSGSIAYTMSALAGGTQVWFDNYSYSSFNPAGHMQWFQIFYSALTDAQIAAQYRDPFMWLRSPSNRFYSIPSGAVSVPWHLFTPVAGGA
jgi:hypothetical protein